jgi:hypothetical protein
MSSHVSPLRLYWWARLCHRRASTGELACVTTAPLPVSSPVSPPRLYRWARLCHRRASVGELAGAATAPSSGEHS